MKFVGRFFRNEYVVFRFNRSILYLAFSVFTNVDISKAKTLAFEISYEYSSGDPKPTEEEIIPQLK